MARMRTTPRALAAALAGALLVTGCSSADDGDPTPPSYEKSDSVQAQVLPQLAANGEDVESADDAAWVVDATIADAEEGTAVTLVAKDDDGWSDVDEQETDAKGRVSLTSRDSGDLHVVVGDGDDAIGTKVSTDDAPEATFTDDFDDEDSGRRPRRRVADPRPGLHRRPHVLQGQRGRRRGRRRRAEAQRDGGPRPRGRRVPAPRASARSSPTASTATSAPSTASAFTYGFAAARIKTQAARGQHAAFWMQAVGGQGTGGPKKGGAEIDVIEYFGDDHPEGGLTSFTYFLDENGKKQTVGGWLPNADELGDDWAEQYHVFSVEWTPDEYVFRIDDKVTQRLKGETVRARPEFLILSLLSSDYELAALQRRAARDHGGRLGAGVGDGSPSWRVDTPLFSGTQRGARGLLDQRGRRVEDEGDRAVVDALDAHVGAEAAALHVGAEALELGADGVVERLAHRARRGGLPGGPAALARVAVQRELADDQHGRADVAGALLVAQEAQVPDLAGRPRDLGRAVVVGDAEVDEESRAVELADDLAVDPHAGGQHPLDDGTHVVAPARVRRG